MIISRYVNALLYLALLRSVYFFILINLKFSKFKKKIINLKCQLQQLLFPKKGKWPMITWRLILKKKRQAIDVKLKIEIIQKSSNKTTECNGEDFFGDDSKDEINILQRYCSAIDSSISAEEYIDITLKKRIRLFLMIILLNLLNWLFNRILRFKLKKI